MPGCRYAHDKFLAAHGLTADTPVPELATALPLTRAWLALASGLLPSLDPSLTTPPPAAAQPASSNIPAQLRSGLGSVSNMSSTATPPAAASQLQQGVSSHSWRGMVRMALVQLAAGDVPVAPHSVAETLAMDAGRLHSAQNAFQNAVVLATCLLLVHQARRGAPRSAADISGARVFQSRQSCFYCSPGLSVAVHRSPGRLMHTFSVVVHCSPGCMVRMQSITNHACLCMLGQYMSLGL